MGLYGSTYHQRPEAQPNQCSTESLGTDSRPWTLNGHRVSCCLADPQPARCTVRFSTTVLLIVVLCNAMKVASMLYVILRAQHKPPVTMGDAIASFLACPDPLTTGKCLWSKHDAQRDGSVTDKSEMERKRWRRQYTRWFRSVSWKRWSILMTA